MKVVLGLKHAKSPEAFLPDGISNLLMGRGMSMLLSRALVSAIASIALLACFSGTSVTARASNSCISASQGRLCTDSRFFRDDRGRVVILRGVNLAGNSKVPPFLPLPKFGDPDATPAGYQKTVATAYSFTEHTDISELDSLPEIGVNVIRLVFNWEAFEPIEGERNPFYLDMVQRIAEGAWKRGIFTIIDFHQDLFSRFLAGGCGDGFPRWAMPSDINAVNPTNGESCRFWQTNGVLNPNADRKQAFVAFYANRDGLKDKYLSMIEAVTTRFTHQDGILGYDLINEPYSGSQEADLRAFYPAVASSINHMDSTAIMFVEPAASSSLGNQTNLKVAPVTTGNVVYAPHFYDPKIIFPGVYMGASKSKSAFSYMLSTANNWRVPLFVGEYGAPSGAIGVNTYMEVLNSLLNESFASGTQWNYTPGWSCKTLDGWNREDLSIVGEDLQIRKQLFLVRAYPQRISGTPIMLQSESSDSSRCLSFRWQNDPALSGESTFFVGKSPSSAVTLTIEPNSPDGDLRCTLAANGWQVVCRSMAPGLNSLTLSYGAPFGRCVPDSAK
jgi:endoglycosylceramidase